MNAKTLSQPATDQPTKSLPFEGGDAPRPVEAAGQLWMARAVIAGVAGLLTWYTWAHWGSFQIDNGREIYVPAEIVKGKLLYRDLWYMYGPLAPYVKALLFWLFGVHLTVLYIFGVTLTIGMALLTFEVSRRFQIGIVASMVPPLFFLSESFYPSIRNFVFPYSYAASLGAFLGMACLLLVLVYASSRQAKHLGLAALLASLVILTKQEIGYACLILLSFVIAASFYRDRSVSRMLKNLALCCGGLLPAMAGYGWFVWKLSARVVFFENWISTPGTFFMRTFSKLTLTDQGFRFVPSELLKAGAFLALALVLWAFIASMAVSAVKELKLGSRVSIAAACVVSLLPLWLAAFAFNYVYPLGFVRNEGWATDYLLLPVLQTVFPTGILFLSAAFSAYYAWKLWKSPADILSLQQACLGVYAFFVGLRQMMELRPTIMTSPPYFNGPAFIVFLIVIYRIIQRVCHPLDIKRANFTIGSLLAGEVALLFVLFGPTPYILPSRFSCEYGSFYTKEDVAILAPQIVSFMKTHTKNGKDILVLPEPPSLYVFAGMEAPSRWYSLVPGYVAPEQEQQYIDELKANQVRYVLVANRLFIEYGVLGFLQGGYNQQIHRWIMDNYETVGQFGPYPPAGFPPYTVWILERKDLVSQEKNAAARPQERKGEWKEAASR